jgi:flagellar biosynthesis protein FlhA
MAQAPAAALTDGPDARSRSANALAIVVIGILATLVVPLPALAVDGLLAITMAASVVVLLVALRLRDPLDLSVFPSLLLLITLLRLALNISTTRLILLHGSEGHGAAGHIVEAFGRFAVGGSVLIGCVVFVILLIVNFAVIAKGSGRISEVAARFTLDALPGKQMSIDADLAAGLIDETQARSRRRRLEQETEFFGAMDGASKFVRGDAVAGLAITVVNIIGGLFAGILRDGLTIQKAAETYTILTIGDGLVSQLPALLVSTAAGLVVTRAGTSGDLGDAFRGQMVRDPAVTMGAAGLLGVLALIPGMPSMVLLTVAGGLVAVSRVSSKEKREAPAVAKAAQAEAKKEERPHDLLAVDQLEIELGSDLVRLVDIARGGELPGRVASLRRRLATDLGILIPSVHLRDDLGLDGSTYRVLLRGLEIGRGQAWADRALVLDPAGGEPEIDGIPARDPAFGLPARWIPVDQRSAAEMRGFTVVDAASTITTHLGELLRTHAHELVGRQEVQELIAVVAKDSPKLVEDIVPAVVNLGDVVAVVRRLLKEGLSVRDLRTVLESMAECAPRSKDPVFLAEQARRRLARHITNRIAGKNNVVRAITLDRSTEQLLRQSLGASDGEPVLALDVENARRLVERLEGLASRMLASGAPVVVLVPPDLRRAFYDFASRFVPDLWVVCAKELLPSTTIEPAGVLHVQGPALHAPASAPTPA